jgi:predicted metal-dependent hydrolase
MRFTPSGFREYLTTQHTRIATMWACVREPESRMGLYLLAQKQVLERALEQAKTAGAIRKKEALKIMAQSIGAGQAEETIAAEVRTAIHRGFSFVDRVDQRDVPIEQIDEKLASLAPYAEKPAVLDNVRTLAARCRDRGLKVVSFSILYDVASRHGERTEGL